MSFIAKVNCFFGMHEGEWTTEGCQQSRFCIFCGKPESLEVHNWPPKDSGRYFKDGSCEMRVTCLDCGITKSIGIRHEGGETEDKVMFEPWWNRRYDARHCRRCGEDLEGPGD